MPAHTDGWYKILSATTVVSMIQGISAIIAYVSGLKMRENIPDLVPKAVFRSSKPFFIFYNIR